MYESIRLASGVDESAINAALDGLKVKRAYPDMVANDELLLALQSQRGRKFVDHAWESEYLGNALRYLYLTYLGDQGVCVNMCYDRNAKQVAPKHILEYRIVDL